MNNRLSEILSELGVTQKELAEKSGLSRARVSYVCNNKSDTRLSTIHLMADSLGVPAYTIIGDYKEPSEIDILEKAANVLGVEVHIVSTKVGGISNIVLPNETALLVENDNEQEFTNSLLKLVSDETLRTNMGKSGWNFVKEKFHYSRLVKDMRNLYQEVL